MSARPVLYVLSKGLNVAVKTLILQRERYDTQNCCVFQFSEIEIFQGRKSDGHT